MAHVTERAIVFDCEGERLVGVISEASVNAKVGVLVLVGGPQYRVGSHRQFLLLARRLAQAGISVMRFDYRGMGDSGGSMSSFERTLPDIEAALDAFKGACSSLEKIVLWGLCDAASAALLYWRLTPAPRVSGMVLVNPWVRSEQSLATTHVKHYYGQRLFEREFWAKLARGGIDVAGALRELAGNVVAATRSNAVERQQETTFQDSMAAALSDFAGPVLLILSGQDYTAKEFLEYAGADSRWRGLIARENVERADLAKADHTFSTAAWRNEVEALTIDWLQRSFGAGK